MKSKWFYMLIAALALSMSQSTFAQRDAQSKTRGEYDFYGKAANRSMRGAREYSQSYRSYAKSPTVKKVDPQVAKETTDSIGEYIVKAKRHMAWMRKQAADDKETLAALDSIDKHLADAEKAHADMCAACMKDHVDSDESMRCCNVIDESLAKAIAEHDKLMKHVAGESKSVKK
jgi:hypothetical protein